MERYENGVTYEHRSFMLIDVENSSGRLDPDLMTLRGDLYAIVKNALDRTSISSDLYCHEDRGDAILLLVDSTVPKVDIVGRLVDHLVIELHRNNEGMALQNWIRLRVALHFGEVQRDNEGWGSDALTTTFRLNEAPVVKKILHSAPRAQSVIVASNDLFQAVIRHAHPSVDADTYHQISVPLGDGTTDAWVRVPGYAVPPNLSGTDPESASVPTSAAGQISIQAGTVKSVFNDIVYVRHDLNIS